MSLPARSGQIEIPYCSNARFLQRRVEKTHKRHECGERSHELGIEARACRKFGRVFAPCQKLPKAQVVGGRMIPGITSWNPGQLFAAQLTDGPPKRMRRDDFVQAPVVGGDVLSDGLEIGR